MASQNMSDLLDAMRVVFDVIIIDSPPLLPVTDAAIVAAKSDGAILIVKHGKTSRSQVASAVSALDAVDARLLGSVLNMMPTKGAEAYGYRSYGYYREEASEGPNNTNRTTTEVLMTDTPSGPHSTKAVQRNQAESAVS